MLLKFFKSNHPYVIFIIPLLGIVLWVPTLFNLNLPAQPAATENTTLLYQWTISPLYNFPKASTVLALLFLILQSYFLIRLNFKYIFIETKTYLPSVVFILFGSILMPYQQLHPVLIGNFFLLFALDKAFVINMERNQIKRYFESGFLIGISALFYPHFYIFILLIWLSLLILRNSTWREWVVPIIGFTIPVVLFFVTLFLFDKHQLFIDHLKNDLFNSKNNPPISHWSFIPLGVMAFVLITSLVWGSLYVGVKKISTRKYFTLFFWFLALIIAAVAFHPSIGFELVYIAAIPAAIIYSIFFSESRRNWMVEFLFILTFLSVFTIIWLH